MSKKKKGMGSGQDERAKIKESTSPGCVVGCVHMGNCCGGSISIAVIRDFGIF